MAQSDGKSEPELSESLSTAHEIDESKFPYGYVPDHLKERVKNWRTLSIGERLSLSFELSEAAWEKIGGVYDPTKPMDKTIRRVERLRDRRLAS
ncbi:MAG: hypothetical protein WBP85_04185 [Terracidiphilus sp.]